MPDPSEVTLAGDYVTISVTIGASAQTLADLAESAISALGYTKTEILQVAVLATQPSVTTDREAILFGGSDAQVGYLPAGDERVWPVRGNRVYVKRAGGADVSAVLEVFLRKQK